MNTVSILSNHAGAASGEVDTSVVNNATKGESRMGLKQADWMTVDNLAAPQTERITK